MTHSNQIDVDKYVHDNIVHQNVDAGIGGSNIILNSLHDSKDVSQVKINTNSLYVPAHSQKTGLTDKYGYIHTNTPGKNIAIRQYETNTTPIGSTSDEYINTKRNVRLKPTISGIGGFDNVGYKPISHNGQHNGGIKHKITNDVLKNKIKQVHFDRNPTIHVY